MEPIIFKELVVDQNNKLCSIKGEHIPLSKKEYELLIFLLNNPNYVHTRESIIEKVWNTPTSLRAVDTTVSRLRKKLREYGCKLETRLGFGYSFNTID
jgi:two-component system OmpR family response regulator